VGRSGRPGIGLPADIAPAIVLLASDGARSIAEQTLSVFGVLTMVWWPPPRSSALKSGPPALGL
jgi:hypothetical protein